MKALDVAILTPLRGGASAAFVGGLLALTHALRSNGIEGRWINQVDLPVAQARHRLVTKALDSGCTHFMWLDADGAIPVDVMGQLLALDVDMVSLPMVLRPRDEDPGAGERTRTFNVGLVDLDQTPKRGAVKVEWSGFGAVWMKRSVLERLVTAHPELTCYEGSAPVHALFDEKLVDGIRYAEDGSFCMRARAIGIEIHALIDVETNHAGLAGHFGREIWAHRVELSSLREEMTTLDTEARSLRAELVTLTEQACPGVDVSKARALVARVPPPERGMSRDVTSGPENFRKTRDFMKATVDSMRAEIARLREPAPAKVAPSTPAVRTVTMPANRRAPCPCGSGERFNACHGPEAS